MALERSKNKAVSAGLWASALTGGLLLDDIWHRAVLGTILSASAVVTSGLAGWRARGARGR